MPDLPRHRPSPTAQLTAHAAAVRRRLTTGIILRIILVTLLASLSDPFQYAFMQRALAEVLLLALPAGLLGAWIVLRRLAFLTHAVGAATFPGLVLGYGLNPSP